MANICVFSCKATGPAESRALLVKKITESIESTAFDGDLVVAIPPGEGEENFQRFFWLRQHEGVWAHEAAQSLEFRGTAKWQPPIESVVILSKAFPDLEFDLQGTTEHEFHETWLIKGGNHDLRELITEELCDPELRGTVTHHVRDGVQITELPGWFSPSSEPPTTPPN